MMILKYLNDVKLIKEYIVVFKRLNADKVGVAISKLRRLQPEEITQGWEYFDLNGYKRNYDGLSLMDNEQFRKVFKIIKSTRKLIEVPQSLKKKYFTSNHPNRIWISI